MVGDRKASKRAQQAAETVSTVAPVLEPTTVQETSIDPAVQHLQEQVSELTRALGIICEAAEEGQVTADRTTASGGLPAPTVHNPIHNARNMIISVVHYIYCRCIFTSVISGLSGRMELGVDFVSLPGVLRLLRLEGGWKDATCYLRVFLRKNETLSGFRLRRSLSTRLGA
jgi:hypothetical protein